MALILSISFLGKFSPISSPPLPPTISYISWLTYSYTLHLSFLAHFFLVCVTFHQCLSPTLDRSYLSAGFTSALTCRVMPASQQELHKYWWMNVEFILFVLLSIPVSSSLFHPLSHASRDFVFLHSRKWEEIHAQAVHMAATGVTVSRVFSFYWNSPDTLKDNETTV